MANCKYFEKTLKTQNCIEEETKSKAYSGNACYMVSFSSEYLPHLFSEIVKIEMQTTITLVLLCGRRTCSVTLSKGLRVFLLCSGIGW